MQSSAEQETMFIWFEAYWNNFAAFAWRSYVESERGLIVLEGEWSDDMSAAYQTSSQAAQQGLRWPNELVEAVQVYEPKSDIVFLIVRGSAASVLAMTTLPGRLTAYAT